MSDVAKLTVRDQQVELPVVEGSEGEVGIDISKLRSSTGAITLDEGYVNTGSTNSAITFLDGEKGVLRYRGYPIEQLAEHCDFVEVGYLLMRGELPTRSELDEFQGRLSGFRKLPDAMTNFFEGFPKDAHPMATLSAGVLAMSNYYQHLLDVHDADKVDEAVMRTLAKIPTIAAYAYRNTMGEPPLLPTTNLDYCRNFLRLMFASEGSDYEAPDELVHALDMLLIVHADHEQNCSTSTVRMVGSSDANLFASISAGICALWGPLHGGANEACVNMLEMIREDGGNVKKYVDMAKDKANNFRIMGFGHRVYKNYDPRAAIVKSACYKVLNKLKINDPVFDIAQKLEEVAATDEYFLERNLYPNVDFYSGVLYRAMNIPPRMFTVLFAMGRLPGWIAHWLEMHASPGKRINRPRQIYTGEVERKVVPIGERG
jgi:citrate synthase